MFKLFTMYSIYTVTVYLSTYLCIMYGYNCYFDRYIFFYILTTHLCLYKILEEFSNEDKFSLTLLSVSSKKTCTMRHHKTVLFSVIFLNKSTGPRKIFESGGLPWNFETVRGPSEFHFHGVTYSHTSNRVVYLYCGMDGFPYGSFYTEK